MNNSISLTKPKMTTLDFSSLMDKAKKYVLAQDVLSLLTDNWCMQNIGNDILYLKHIYVEEEHSLYQIILSHNTEYSGVYKMELRGKDFQCKFDSTKEIFAIKTNNYFELSPFYTSKQIMELRVEDAVDFKESLFENIAEFSVDHLIFTNRGKKTYIRNLDLKQFKTKVLKFYEKNKATITDVSFVEKKKEYYISRFDLSEQEFKKQLIGLGYVTEQEYNLYSNKNTLDNSLIKIEII